jgi:hypothetical protein|tara:strand:- start:2171 stop:2758 length:588 start_codon:yes stop_codon:yes gene_type:complete
MAYNTMQQSVLNKSRADKFLLVFDIPPILKEFNTKFKQDNTSIISDSVQFSIFGTAVPEITVPAVENRYAGNTLYVSSHSKNSYPPVSVKFNVDNEYKNYWVIYQWLNLLHDQYDGRYNAREINSNSPDENFKDYQANLTIYGKDEFNNNRIKFTYTKAFPTTVDTIDYNYQNADEISSGFTFVYSQLHTEVMDF